jgi:hypothetical protein
MHRLSATWATWRSRLGTFTTFVLHSETFFAREITAMSWLARSKLSFSGSEQKGTGMRPSPAHPIDTLAGSVAAFSRRAARLIAITPERKRVPQRLGFTSVETLDDAHPDIQLCHQERRR